MIEKSTGRAGGGIALMLTSSASNQVGAAIGALAFPLIGPVGVVAVRQFMLVLVLVPTVRPKLRSMTRQQWWPVLGLALVFSVMNLSVYAAIERIGLGLAITLEFLGPLAVAIIASRRGRDLAAALVAGIGVVLLTRPGASTDVLGVALALLAAASWACYILLNQSVGRHLPGLQGTAAASLVTAAAWMPVAIIWFSIHPPSLMAILLAAACGVLASVVPYVVDVLALRRVSAQVFSMFTSVNPLWAAVAGFVVLGQALGVWDWIGIGLIVASNVVVSIRSRSRRVLVVA